MAQLLIGAGADMTSRARGGITALMVAAVTGHADAVKLLVEAGADIHARNNRGYTALDMVAALDMVGDSDEIARILRAAGAR